MRTSTRSSDSSRKAGQKSNLKPRPLKTEVRALGGVKIKDLTGYVLDQFSERDIRRAYTELRRVALTRVERAQKAGIMTNQKAEYLKKRLPTLSEIDKKQAAQPEYQQTFKETLYDISIMETKYILLNDRTTKSGHDTARDKALESLRLKGGAYEYISEENIDEFGEYMESLREKYDLERGSRGSEQAVMLFKAYKQHGIAGEDIIRDFKFWQENRASLEKQALKTKAGKLRTVKDYKKAVQATARKAKRREKRKKKR